MDSEIFLVDSFAGGAAQTLSAQLQQYSHGFFIMENKFIGKLWNLQDLGYICILN